MARQSVSVDFALDVPTSFEVHQLPPTKAFKLAAKIGRLFGPALPELLGSTKNGKGLGELDLSQLGGGLQKLLMNVTDTELDALIPDLLCGVTMVAEGKKLDLTKLLFEHKFTGYLPQSFELLAKVVKVNFLDFFQGPSGAEK